MVMRFNIGEFGARVDRTVEQTGRLLESILAEIAGSLPGFDRGEWLIGKIAVSIETNFLSHDHGVIDDRLYRQIRRSLAKTPVKCWYDVEGVFGRDVSYETVTQFPRLFAKNSETGYNVMLSGRASGVWAASMTFGERDGGNTMPDGLDELFDWAVSTFSPSSITAGFGSRSRLDRLISSQGLVAGPVLNYRLWLNNQPGLDGLSDHISQRPIGNGTLFTLLDDNGDPFADESLDGRAFDATLELGKRFVHNGDLEKFFGLKRVGPGASERPHGEPSYYFDGYLPEEESLVSLIWDLSPVELRNQAELEEVFQLEARRQLRYAQGLRVKWLVTSDEVADLLTHWLSDSEFELFDIDRVDMTPRLA